MRPLSDAPDGPTRQPLARIRPDDCEARPTRDPNPPVIDTAGRYRIARGKPVAERPVEREFPRVEAVFQVEYPTIDDLVVAYSSDLSKGGMFLCTQRFLPLSAVIQLQLELPEGEGKLPIICRVVYIRDNTAAAAMGKPAGMGLEFLDLTDDRRRRLEALITQLPERESQRPTLVREPVDVLVVDDDPQILRAASRAFLERGDAVRTATNGLDALARCLKKPPDVILCDVQMPKMDGWQFLRMVRARPTLASVPFVFHTTLSGEAERLHGYKLGVDDYIAKPASPDELVTRIDRLLNRLSHSGRSHAEQKTLRGDLEQVSLPSVLSFLELERQTGILLLVGAFTVRLYLFEGRPVRIERGDEPQLHAGRPLLDEVLSWGSGQFEFATQDVTCEDTLQVSLTALLLDHARRTDEADKQ